MYIYTHTLKKGNTISFFYDLNPSNKAVNIKKYKIKFSNFTTGKALPTFPNYHLKRVLSQNLLTNGFKEKMIHHISKLKHHVPLSVHREQPSLSRLHKKKLCIVYSQKPNKKFQINQLSKSKNISPMRNIFFVLKKKSEHIQCSSPNTTRKLIQLPEYTDDQNSFNTMFSSTAAKLSMSLSILLASISIKILWPLNLHPIPILGLVLMIVSLGIIIGKVIEVQSTLDSQLFIKKSS